MTNINEKKLKDMQAMGFDYQKSCSDVENKKYRQMLEAGEELPKGIAPDKVGGFEWRCEDCYTPYTFHDFLLTKQVSLMMAIRKTLSFIALFLGAGLVIGFFVAFWSFM